MAGGKKNANGAGTISKRGDRYVARVSVPGTKGAKRKGVSGRTWSEGHDKMVELQARMNGKPPPEVELLSVGEYLERWLKIAATNVSHSTLRSYKLVSKEYVEPILGHMRLDTLNRSHIEDLKASVSHLKASSIRCVLKTFSVALNHAVEEGYLESNPARKVKRPKDKRRMRALSRKEATRLMTVVPPEEKAYYDVAIKLGLRQGSSQR